VVHEKQRKATRAPKTSDASIEGEARPASLVEGATRAPKTSDASIEGEARPASLVEGATRAPLIEDVDDNRCRY